MIISSRRTRFILAALAMIFLGISLGLIWLARPEPQLQPTLVLTRQPQAAAPNSSHAVAVEPMDIITDDLRAKFDPQRTVAFHVTSTHDTSIFVVATGTQILTDSGWQTETEEHRGEIWRLKAGVAREVCV